jgi:ATP-dependent Clp protease adaptor protein ClpS
MLAATTKSRVVANQPRTQSRQPPRYKLLLHNDISFEVRHTSKVLVKTIDDMVHEEAIRKTWEAFLQGVAVLGDYPQELAEDYCHTLRLNSVKSTIEPV